MGEAVEKKKQTWLDVLEANKDQFAMALPRGGITPERVMRTALTAMKQNPMLMKSDPKTVISSLLQACELGLSVSNTLGHAYLVPFKNNKKGTIDCTLIVGYRGYLELMKRSQQVSDVKATIVYENEPFEMESGDRPYLKHKQLPPSTRGKGIVGAYAVVLFKDGTSTFEWMWYEDIMKLKARSKASKEGPWITDEEEMIKKCPIRRIGKRMPLAVELQKAAVIDEYNEVGVRAGDMWEVDDTPEKPLEETVKPAAAVEAPKEEKAPEPEPQKQEEGKPQSQPPEEAKQPEPNAQEPVRMITDAQVKALTKVLDAMGCKDVTAEISGIVGKKIVKAEYLTFEQGAEVIKALQERIKKSAASNNTATA